MKLEYKILWLDDKIQDFIDDEVIEEVENYLIELNFVPKIYTVKNSTEFFKYLDNSYDLILTDFHMNDINGDEVIEKLRGEEYSVMTEVLFYTAKADLKDTQKISRISFLETNSLSGTHIENVIEKTTKLINLTIKKFQHIVAMRGMIMHETSSLDAQMLEIIKKTIKDKNIDFSELSEQIFDSLLALFESKIKFIKEDCKEKNNFKRLTKDTFVYSSKYKIDTLSQIITQLGLVDFSKEYQDEIISIRNKFAHAILEKEEGREFFKYKEEGITFDEEYCKKIRKNIIKHKGNLDTLNEKLG